MLGANENQVASPTCNFRSTIVRLHYCRQQNSYHSTLWQQSTVLLSHAAILKCQGRSSGAGWGWRHRSPCMHVHVVGQVHSSISTLQIYILPRHHISSATYDIRHGWPIQFFCTLWPPKFLSSDNHSTYNRTVVSHISHLE